MTSRIIPQQQSILKLLLFLAVFQLAPLIGCQQQQSSPNNTLATTTTPVETTTTKTSEALLSGSEFVDFTEAPTILFDGTSNESNETSDNSATTTSSPSPQVPSGANKNNEKENESQNKTTATTTPPPTSNATTITPPREGSNISDSIITTTVSTVAVDSEVIGGEVDDDGVDTESDDNEDEGGTQDGLFKEQPFELPQNVSQYMDYIERLFHDLRHQITDLFEPHIPQLIRTSQMVQLSGSCSYDMLRMALALRQFEPWALRMIDSSGKVPEGIFEGSFTALGSYDECLSTVFASSAGSPAAASSTSSSSGGNNGGGQISSSSSNGLTQGKYCLVNVSPFLPPKPPADKVERMFQEEANRRNYTKDDQFSRLSPMFYYMKFRIGVCIPSTCIDSDMDSISSALSSSLRLNITIPHCRVKLTQPITKHQLAGGIVFALVLAIVLGATLMDYTQRNMDRRLAQHEIVVLSVVNVDEVVSHNTKKPISHIGKEKHPAAASVIIRNRTSRTIDSQTNANGQQPKGNNFSNRLDKHWSWMSFSLLANHRLYFRHHTARATEMTGGCGGIGGNGAKLEENIFNGNKQQESTYQKQPPVAMHHRVTTTDQSLIFRCLNGIRVLSLCWVIIANSYITLDPRATKRLTKTREAPKDFLFQMVAQASLAIETFFFLSGILMSLSFVRKFNPELTSSSGSGFESGRAEEANDEKQELKVKRMAEWRRRKWSYALRWLQFYIHRYIRMTPATMLVIAFTMFAFRYGDGPLWFEATHKAHLSCSENWWRHLLHVANFIDTRQMCFIHYWYIAADMQLFLFAPILMFLLYKRQRIGYAVLTLIGLTSISFVFYKTYIQSLPPTLLFYNSDPESRREFGNTIMTKPLTHALPYIVGMLVGKWLTSQHRQMLVVSNNGNSLSSSKTQKSSGKRSNHLSGSAATLFGLIATLVALVEVFLPYKWNNSHLPTRFLASLYAALFRFGWSLALAYLVVSCRHKRDKRCRANEERDMMNATRRQRRQQLANNNNNTVTTCCNCACSKIDSSSHNPSVDPGWIKASSEEQFSHHHHHYQQQVHQRNQHQQLDDGESMCFCGSGGNLVNRLLSLNVFTHLSKLSFVAYLIHLPLMSVFIAQTRGLFAFSHTLVIHLALSYLVMTFILSFILVHIIEFPFITFERYLFEKLLYKLGKKFDTTTEATTNGNDNGWIRKEETMPATKKRFNNKMTSINGGYIEDEMDRHHPNNHYTQMMTTHKHYKSDSNQNNSEAFKISERL